MLDNSRDELGPNDISLNAIKKRMSTNTINDYRGTPRRSTDTKTRFAEFNLSKGGAHRGIKPIKHTALNLVEKIKTKKYLRDLMPKSQMFMIITQIHKTSKDFLEKTDSNFPLYGYVYDYIMNKYGIKKIADKKFKQLCSTVRRYKETNPRSYIFGKFMGLFQHFDRTVYEEYTSIKDAINNLNIGFMPNNIDSDVAHFVPYIRVTKYMSANFESSLKQSEYKKLTKKAEKLKKTDKKGKNLPGIINIDAFILMILSYKYAQKPKGSEDIIE